MNAQARKASKKDPIISGRDCAQNHGKNGRSAASPAELDEHSPRGGPSVRLGKSDFALLLAQGRETRFAPEAAIFRQGDTNVSSFLVLNGLVRTFYSSPLGKEITLAYWSNGDLIGGPHFLSGSFKHVWSAKAIELTSALVFRSADLERLCTENPGIAKFVIETVSLKLNWVSMLLQTLGTQSVCVRLARLLLQLAEMYGVEIEDGTLLRHNFTQEDLANMVGATRQWVSITLGSFQRDKIILIRKRQLIILDKELLSKVAR
ncbi:MAG: Crp/Fnr family transcriptional regulator [Methylibium sp.]|uniref:Crp/Fnr family transcriptional regulator n=1 Tax=Methylibium sp. TaxID=2067992 RepID=UPI0017CB4B19|nr:Crp/Fnr family transcriptional regulator [Methylibium sp.]MBA3597046.1 Crp/Fnr family transcriptional regulator [Methylibium sp.]